MECYDRGVEQLEKVMNNRTSTAGLSGEQEKVA